MLSSLAALAREAATVDLAAMLRDRTPPPDPHALALGALGWLLADDDRAERLLSLTGMTPDDLRAGVGDPATLTAVMDFLMAHEPDLIGAAQELGVAPEVLANAARRLAA